ncbi:hypothetical protein B0H13DRAFT_1905081 [Mycena leptocephala]|nr:hypothetical protein B0H13DRAFT_1905081 [Mycena leptocephala]
MSTSAVATFNLNTFNLQIIHGTLGRSFESGIGGQTKETPAHENWSHDVKRWTEIFAKHSRRLYKGQFDSNSIATTSIVERISKRTSHPIFSLSQIEIRRMASAAGHATLQVSEKGEGARINHLDVRLKVPHLPNAAKNIRTGVNQGSFANIRDLELQAGPNARREHFCGVDIVWVEKPRLDRLEIGLFGCGNGGDQDACEPHRGRVADNCCGDHDSENQDHDFGASGKW